MAIIYRLVVSWQVFWKRDVEAYERFEGKNIGKPYNYSHRIIVLTLCINLCGHLGGLVAKTNSKNLPNIMVLLYPKWKEK